MDAISVQTRSAEETMDLGRRLAGALRRGDVVGLVGPLGAGKTQLTRGLAAGLGADPRQVASPTFILMSEYAAPTPVVHIDAYRINSLSDLESIGFTDELLNSSITIVEWADRIEGDMPADHLRIEISHTEGGRDISLEPRGALVDRAAELARLLDPPPATAIPQSTCRTCSRPIRRDLPTFPFCSDRCRLVDLNKWFKGHYSLSRPLDAGEDQSET